MAGTANRVRYPGKPTSGRYVYQATRRVAGRWFWQCDLHDDPVSLPDQYGEAPTMQEAFALAYAHALVCAAESPTCRCDLGSYFTTEADDARHPLLVSPTCPTHGERVES